MLPQRDFLVASCNPPPLYFSLMVELAKSHAFRQTKPQDSLILFKRSRFFLWKGTNRHVGNAHCLVGRQSEGKGDPRQSLSLHYWTRSPVSASSGERFGE